MTAEEHTHIPWFPTDYIFACIDNAGAAEAAAKELRDAGFHAQEVRYLHGDEALQRIEVECEHCNLVLRTLRFIWRAMTEEGTILTDLAEEASHGHNVLAVHVTSHEKIDVANEILSRYRAHRVEYWGHHGVVRHLSGV